MGHLKLDRWGKVASDFVALHFQLFVSLPCPRIFQSLKTIPSSNTRGMARADGNRSWCIFHAKIDEMRGYCETSTAQLHYRFTAYRELDETTVECSPDWSRMVAYLPVRFNFFDEISLVSEDYRGGPLCSAASPPPSPTFSWNTSGARLSIMIASSIEPIEAKGPAAAAPYLSLSGRTGDRQHHWCSTIVYPNKSNNPGLPLILSPLHIQCW